MIKPSDIFLLENRFMTIRKGSYDLHTGQLQGQWLEMLPPLLPFVEITADLQPFEATEDAPSDAQSYTISANNLYANIGVTAPQNYELSLDGVAFAPSLSLTSVNGVITDRTIYVRLKNNVAGNYVGVINHRTTGYSENVAVEGVVYPAITQIKYGFLYNWWATQEQGTGVWLVGDDMRSEGWDVPSDSDFTTLATYLGNESVAGGKLKETGLTYWDDPNTGATNEVGFNARGAGLRDLFYTPNSFVYILKEFYCWVKDYESALYIINNDTYSEINDYTGEQYGVSIRPVRPATVAEQALPDGELSGVYYYGNDGKIYRVTKIGTQVWLADNLAETKWSDGSWIAGYDGGTYTPITDANWAALTTAALCAYDDDESNVLI